LTGVGAGQVLSFEKSKLGVPTAFLCTEGNMSIDANDKEMDGPAESETLSMRPYTICREPGDPDAI
jgi:hypothetical protein